VASSGLTVIWLRHYVTQEALGYVFGVSDTTALRAIGRVLPVLEAAGRATMRTPPPARRQRYGVAETLRAFPKLADLDDEARVVDSCEQRVQRPTEQQEADRQYAGKKKAHTLKVQVVVEVGSGHIREVAPSVPGPCADPTLLRDSGALERLPPGTRMLGDKADRWKKTEQATALPPPVAIPRRKPRGKPLPPEDGVVNGAFACVRITARARHPRPAHLSGAQPCGPPPPAAHRADLCGGGTACPPGAVPAAVISAAWPNRGLRGGGNSRPLLLRR